MLKVSNESSLTSITLTHQCITLVTKVFLELFLREILPPRCFAARSLFGEEKFYEKPLGAGYECIGKKGCNVLKYKYVRYQSLIWLP